MKVKKGDFVWFFNKYTLDREIEAGVVVDIDLWWCHIIPTGETEPIKIHRDGVASSHEGAERLWALRSPP